MVFNNVNGQNKSDDIDLEHVENDMNCHVTGETAHDAHQNADELLTKKLRKHFDKNSLETLTLTHDNMNGYKLEFDDIDWKKNINSLKPLVLTFNTSI